jgi:hypothetical protein
MTLKTLLVGAGAVGLSYGWYLARAGCDVAYLVKPAHAAALEGGTNLYFPKRRGLREPRPFVRGEGGYRVLTNNAEVAAEPWDFAILCVSATALRGPWLEPFLAALSERTTLVMLTPGADDLAYLSARHPRERIIAGLITLVAWQSPLPDEAPHPPGIAVWFPPMTKLPFWGEPARTGPLVDALRRGGAPAKAAGTTIRPGGPLASGLLTTHVAALDGAGWTFAGLGKSPLKKLAARAARQAMVVLAAHQGRRAPLMRGLVRPWLVGAGLRIAASRMPFSFEVYLRYHFTKVRDQTAFTLGELVRIGRDKGLEVGAIDELRRAVFG